MTTKNRNRRRDAMGQMKKNGRWQVYEGQEGCKRSIGLGEKYEKFNFLVKHAWRHLVVKGAKPPILFYQLQ